MSTKTMQKLNINIPLCSPLFKVKNARNHDFGFLSIWV